MIDWFKNFFATPPPSELDKKRDALYDDLEGLSFEDRMKALDKLLETDPELYASWITTPYERN